MKKFKKELIEQRHWSLNESNNLYFTNEQPALQEAFTIIKNTVKQFFNNDNLTYDINTTSVFKLGNEMLTTDVTYNLNEYDKKQAVLELGKTIAVDNSEPIVQLIFNNYKHWPNGSGKSPDYIIKLPCGEYFLEVKAVQCKLKNENDSNDNRLICSYNNALRNKYGVIEELQDNESEISKTICLMIYYYIDVDNQLVYYIDADVVAMPLLLNYKINDEGYAFDLNVKSAGENSQNNNASIGLTIMKGYQNGNTLYDVYKSFLNHNILITNNAYKKQCINKERVKIARENLHKKYQDFVISYNVFNNNITSVNKKMVYNAYDKFNTACKNLQKCINFQEDDTIQIENYMNIILNYYHTVKNTKITPQRKAA